VAGERSAVPGGVTVVMPLYNKGPHVERAIRSVIQQTAGFDALIVVDDGSTDDGPDRIAAFTDPRLQLLRRSPPGPGGYAARNHAIRRARTEWIAFLDADDAWQPEFTRTIASLIEDYGDAIGCAFTSFDIRHPNGANHQQRFGADRRAAGRSLLQFEEFLNAWLEYRDSPIWTGATALRRDILLEAGLFPEGRCTRGGDKDLWLRAVALKPAAFDPNPLATYFRDSTNMVTSQVKVDAPHCIVATIQEMIGRQNGRVLRRLKSLNNVETFARCLSAARSGTLHERIYDILYDKYRDYRYYLIALLQRAPVSLRPTLAKTMQRALRFTPVAADSTDRRVSVSPDAQPRPTR
jgi:succinoglycan biosynthesis protein ExoO